jgi:hypothetical protein
MSTFTESTCRTAYYQLRRYLDRAGYVSPEIDWATAWASWAAAPEEERCQALDLDCTHATRPPVYVHFCKPTVNYRKAYLGTVIHNFRLKREVMIVFVLHLQKRDKPDRAVAKHDHLVSYFSYDELQKDLQSHYLNPLSCRLVSEEDMKAFLNQYAVTRHLTLEIPPIYYYDAYMRSWFFRPGDYVIAQVLETHAGVVDHPRRVVSGSGLDDVEPAVKRPLDDLIL